jgi:hypothetical protein
VPYKEKKWKLFSKTVSMKIPVDNQDGC